MGNAKSMSTGGASSAVGPALMRKAAPFRVAARDMMVAERTIWRDNLFSSARAQIGNLSFALDRSRISPELDSKMQAVQAQLRRTVTFGREGK